uniref:type 1 glutamine amidotransferase n=1 Tax=Microbacterium sp. TaxID=51671 RepID=UPI0028AF1510
MTPRVLVIVNSASSGPRRLGTWLREKAIDVDEIVGAEQPLPTSLDGYAGLVMLGGGLMPDDDDRAPWLAAERALAAEAVARDLPTLGICLGGQLLAHVAGGEVAEKTGPIERGATPIRPTAAGRTDAVFAALGDEAPMIENHQDMITRLPPAAVLLASSAAVENQAFRLGARVRGVQFHPEASAADLARWDDAALRGEGRSLPALID